MKGITVAVDTTRLQNLIQNFGIEMAEAAPEVAAAGAKVIYDEVKTNVRKLGRKTGNLDRSIYRKLSEELSNRPKGRIVYNISWNHKKAPHGRLLEWGWWQRYQTLIDKRGQWVTAVQPQWIGKPRPKLTTQAQRDAYFVPLKGGPKYRPGYAFVRNAQSAFPRAVNAMEYALMKRLGAM